MASARVDNVKESVWGGGVLPYAIGSKKLGMWLFIVSDSLTFAGLLVGYSYLRVASPHWPMPFHFWPSIAMASLMTFFLLSSSLTMVLAVSASARGNRSQAARFIWLTILGGWAFILLHANEWRTLIAEGLKLTENPWAPDVPLFGAAFFTLTGLHMFHVFSGTVYLAVIALAYARGRLSHEDVEVSGLYWHFVDLVWMFIFPLVYLLSARV